MMSSMVCSFSISNSSLAFFFFSSRRRHTRCSRDWSSDVCSSDLLIARKDMKLEWPRMETKTHWIMMGFDEDLNKALVNAVRETVNFLEAQQMVPLNRYEAYSLASMAADCRVTQVVDIRKGVHCMVPKSLFVKK